MFHVAQLKAFNTGLNTEMPRKHSEELAAQISNNTCFNLYIVIDATTFAVLQTLPALPPAISVPLACLSWIRRIFVR